MADSNTQSLAPPAVSSLRAESGHLMHRSLSEDMREEREDLREAAEQTLNIIMDLGLDGIVRWVSPSWTDVIGTPLSTVQGLPIADILVGDNRNIFRDVVESMKKDDTRSQIVRFAVLLGEASRLYPGPVNAPEEASEDSAQSQLDPPTIDLEGQGIMVFDRASGGGTHVSLLSRNCSRA